MEKSSQCALVGLGGLLELLNSEVQLLKYPLEFLRSTIGYVVVCSLSRLLCSSSV